MRAPRMDWVWNMAVVLLAPHLLILLLETLYNRR